MPKDSDESREDLMVFSYPGSDDPQNFSSSESDTLSEIEDNGLAKFMEEAESDETLTVHEAKKFYRSLKKD